MIFQHTYKLILAGKKTQTRRLKAPNMTVGRSHAVQPGRGRKAVARIVVKGIRQERLGDISAADAKAEGYRTREEFFASWRKIHGGVDLGVRVWVVEFRLDAQADS